jgi:hypothetical protein
MSGILIGGRLTSAFCSGALALVAVSAQADTYTTVRGNCSQGLNIDWTNQGISGTGFQCEFTGAVISAGSGIGLYPSLCFVDGRRIEGRVQISVIHGTDDFLLELPGSASLEMYPC